MGYVESNLGKDEKILARVTHSKAGLVSAFLVAVVLLGVTVGIGYLTQYLSDLLNGLTMKNAEWLVVALVALLIVLAVLFGLIGIFYFIHAAVEISCNQLVVTNKRLLGRSGFIAKKTMDIILLKLDTINATNGVLGALFHYGTLVVVSAGSQQIINGVSVNLKFPYVKNTEAFRRAVLAAIDKAKEEEREAQAEAQAEAMRRAQEKIRSENKS